MVVGHQRFYLRDLLPNGADYREAITSTCGSILWKSGCNLGNSNNSFGVIFTGLPVSHELIVASMIVGCVILRDPGT